MYATSLPTPQQPDNLPLALQQARERLLYLYRRWSNVSTPDLERANVYGEMDTLDDMLAWLDSIVSVSRSLAERRIQLGVMYSLVKANWNRVDAESINYAHLNGMKLHQLATGRRQAYTYILAMLESLGIKPLR